MDNTEDITVLREDLRKAQWANLMKTDPTHSFVLKLDRVHLTEKLADYVVGHKNDEEFNRFKETLEIFFEGKGMEGEQFVKAAENEKDEMVEAIMRAHFGKYPENDFPQLKKIFKTSLYSFMNHISPKNEELITASTPERNNEATETRAEKGCCFIC